MGITSSSTQFEQERVHLALVHINAIKKNLQSGVYPLASYPCFCGSTSEIEIFKKERNGIPHRAVLCNECSLIRINPRMSGRDYVDFYNKHYRHINFGAYLEEHLHDYKEEDVMMRTMAVDKGHHLLAKYLEFKASVPEVVLDWGCHQGGMLEAFKEHGSKVYGVEVDASAADKARAKGVPVFTTIDETINAGVKADLVIMQDLIEHLMDLNEVRKIHELLTESGYLYVWTPGLFVQEPRVLFQIAHTYQFHASSLDYVMNCLGFKGHYLDEGVSSFWISQAPEEPPIKPTEWVQYSLDHLNNEEVRALPVFKATCKFTRKERHDNIRQNCAQGIEDLHVIRNTYSGPVMIVSGGPSVDGQMEKIKEMHDEHVPLIVIARMYPWAVKNEMAPVFVVSMDSMLDQEKGFVNLCRDTIHLISSSTRPSIVKRLEGHLMYLWDGMDDPEVRKIRQACGYETVTVVNGGGTVTIAAMSLAMVLGFRDLHVFGFDCLVPRDEKKLTHAEGISGISDQANKMEITVGDEKIISTFPFIDFAKQGLDMVQAGHVEGFLDSISFYGDCLLTKLWDGKFVTEEEKEKLDGDNHS